MRIFARRPLPQCSTLRKPLEQNPNILDQPLRKHGGRIAFGRGSTSAVRRADSRQIADEVNAHQLPRVLDHAHRIGQIQQES